MKRIRLLWIMAVLLVANFVAGIHVVAKLSTSEGLAKLDLIPQAMYIIEKNYVEPVEKEKLVHGAVRGMLGSLDLHSEFLPPMEARNMEVKTSGTYGGLGIEITETHGLITVVSPFVDSPAYRAGLMAGDRIVKVDDELLRNVERKDVLSKLRGEPGTKVTLVVVRYDPRLRRETIKSFTLTRAIIKVNSIVEPRILEDSIGYVRITQFQKRTASDLHKALANLESRGITALILDLRDNPGGLLPAAVEVADLFIPGGRVIVSLKGRKETDAHDYVSHENGTHPMYPVIVLINGQSASGSEIVAAALQDLKRGVIVGETSYGKALVQTMFRVGPKSALKLTTGKYYTPSGRSIQGKGIEPDVVVSVTPEQELQRRNQKYKEMADALDPESRKPSADGETSPAEEELLDLLFGKTTEPPEFIDIQLREAVRIAKALKAIGADGMLAMSPAEAA